MIALTCVQVTYATAPEFVTRWGARGSGPGQFDNPTAIAVSDAGEVLVSDYLNARIQVFTKSGVFLRQFPTGDPSASRPAGFAIDAAGDLWVADLGRRRLLKVHPDGTVVRSVEVTTTLGDVAIDASGMLYVAWWGLKKIAKYDADGTAQTLWDLPDSGNSLGLSSFLTMSGSSVLYATNPYNDRIYRFTQDGSVLGSFGGSGSAPGQFHLPAGLAMDGAGNVLVADMQNRRVQKLTADGLFLLEWGHQGRGDGEFVDPIDIALDAAGDVYVLDGGQCSVQVFRFAPVTVVPSTWTTVKTLYGR